MKALGSYSMSSTVLAVDSLKEPFKAAAKNGEWCVRSSRWSVVGAADTYCDDSGVLESRSCVNHLSRGKS